METRAKASQIRRRLPVTLAFVLSIIVLLFADVAAPGLAQSDATPTPWIRHSIFPRDTCAPPCFFGLTPGESTTRDAVYMLVQFRDVFWWRSDFRGNIFDRTGYLTDGAYDFYWRDFDWTDFRFQQSDIVIRNGTVDWLKINRGQRITLEQTLEALGTPDQARLLRGPYATPFLDLIYLEPRLRITLIADRHACTLLNIGQDFWVDYVYYYSPRAAQELVPSGQNGEQAPALVAYETLASQRYIPPETWQAWLNGEANMTCADGWDQLPEDPVFPSMTSEATPRPTIKGRSPGNVVNLS